MSEWFVARKDERAMQKESREAAEQQVRNEFAYMEWLNEQRDTTFRTAFTPERLKERLREIEQVQVSRDPKLLRWTPESRDIYMRDQLWRQMRVTMQLPTLEEWVELVAEEARLGK